MYLHYHLQTKKEITQHPWAKSIKEHHAHIYKIAHNSINNPKYPFKENKMTKPKDKFTVIGNFVTKEFIYCVRLVQGLHKYRKHIFDTPIIRGVTGVEWPAVWNDIKIKFGGKAYCLQSQVAVVLNGEFIGGELELKSLIESTYKYHLKLDYCKESIKEFYKFVKSSGRPCTYMHICIDDDHIGTLIFMLYADIAPNTCENFLRLCRAKRGGYNGTPIHRIVKDGWIQCGGFGLKTTNLDCENFIVPHDRRGVLCMANDGRHVDCSTQFFVLLQPAPWMAHKYVAFGQLIEGEGTLKKIESVPTWYESPLSDIKILKSGILNMECQDIKVTKGTKEYLKGHVEDLVALGNLLYESLIDKVFIVIEFKRIALLDVEPESPELNEEEIGSLRATKRFIKNKQDIEKQLQSNQAENRQSVDSDNQEFDVDVYEYESEESSYQHVSLTEPSVVTNEEKPYYLPLTDVPYPDEVDSVYDLKKFLKGNYCLESDLKKDQIFLHETKQFSSELFDLDDDESVSSSVESLASDDEKEIRKYIKMNVDRVSFAGDVIRNIAGGTGKFNLFQDFRKSELITDDELRRFRLASIDQRAREERKVSISLPDEAKQVHTKIKRRQTGFVRPEDLERIHIIQKPSFDESSDIDESTTNIGRKVRISPTAMSPPTARESSRRPTAFVRPSDDNSDTEMRRSVLTRLYEEVTATDEIPGPTLKDYKPISETHRKNLMFLTYSPRSHVISEENAREKYIRRSLTTEKNLYEPVLNLQHGRRVAHKISSDYVKTIDQIEHRLDNSLRSIEFAKVRPTLSVAEYQMKNSKFKELKKSTNGELKTETVMMPPHDFDQKRSVAGLRSPDDTPPSISDEENAFEK